VLPGRLAGGAVRELDAADVPRSSDVGDV